MTTASTVTRPHDHTVDTERAAAIANPSPGGLAMSASSWLLLLALSVIWGGSYFFIKVAVDDFGPLTIVLGRVLIAAVILHLVIVGRGMRMPSTLAAWKPFIVMSLLNSLVPYSLIVWGETHIASGLAAILGATVPIFTIVLAHFLTADEHLSPARVGGVVLGLLGVIVIIGDDLFAIASDNGLAQLAILASAVSYALSGIFGRRLKGTPPLVSATGQMTSASTILLPIALLIERPWANATPHLDSAGAIVGLATLCTAVAYLLFFRVLALAGASNVSVVTFLIPVSSLILGALFLGESIVPRHLLGMALIGLAMLAIDNRLTRRWKARRTQVASAPAAGEPERIGS